MFTDGMRFPFAVGPQEKDQSALKRDRKRAEEARARSAAAEQQEMQEALEAGQRLRMAAVATWQAPSVQNGVSYGYARASTEDQSIEIQLAALKAAGCTTIRSEKRSGTSTAGRDELRTLLDFLREGDTLVVTRIDRLARSVGDLADIVRELRTRGATLRATEQPIDTGTAAGKAFLDMLGVFAEFETNLRRERQAEGIAKAKAAGVYKGRKPSVDREAVRRLSAEGIGPAEIARRLGIGRATVYRLTRPGVATKPEALDPSA